MQLVNFLLENSFLLLIILAKHNLMNTQFTFTKIPIKQFISHFHNHYQMVLRSCKEQVVDAVVLKIDSANCKFKQSCDR